MLVGLADIFERFYCFLITLVKLFSIKKIQFKRSVIFVVNQKGGVGKICFIIICEIRWVNSSIYIFFKVFWHGIMVLIKNLLCQLERAVKSYEAII